MLHLIRQRPEVVVAEPLVPVEKLPDSRLLESLGGGGVGFDGGRHDRCFFLSFVVEFEAGCVVRACG